MSEREGLSLLEYPFDHVSIARHRLKLKKCLEDKNRFLAEKKIAILGASTTHEIKNAIELFLMNRGVSPVLYESDYGQYLSESHFPGKAFSEFEPDLVYFHTTVLDKLSTLFEMSASGFEEKAVQEVETLVSAATAVHQNFGSDVLVNNLEYFPMRALGNLDALDQRGINFFIKTCNAKLEQKAGELPWLHIHDNHYLSAQVGLDSWFDERLWFAYKYAISQQANIHLGHSLAALMSAIWGLSKKALVLDLDNTLWGGVIGDDGAEGIRLGEGDPVSEAHLFFQKYVGLLKNRGVVLAINSKNDRENAIAGLQHESSVLQPEDFAIIQANWELKTDNIHEIAEALDLGEDALVFVDDNPVERQLVSERNPPVAVVDIADAPEEFARLLDRNRWFDTALVSEEDLKKAMQYQSKAKFNQTKTTYADYNDFLHSLDMQASILPLNERNQQRVLQLCNKTNQFNLCTRRYTAAEIEQRMNDDSYVCLTVKLRDRFGDHGLIAVLIAVTKDGNVLEIENFLMSCRVLQRKVEYLLFEKLVNISAEKGINTIVGTYMPTKKNKMVAGLLDSLGFGAKNPSGEQAFAVANGYRLQPVLIDTVDEKDYGKEPGT